MSFLFKIFLGQLLISGMALWLPASRNLEYEYAWQVSVLIVLCAFLACLFKPSQWYVSKASMSWRLCCLMVLTPIVTLVPGALVFATGQCSCSGNGFLFWMILLVIPASWISMGLIQVVALLEDAGKTRCKVLIASLPFISIIISLGFLWFLPQKRVTAVALGFLHGPIYDRMIELDGGVLLTRLGHGFIGLLALVVAGGLVSMQSGIFRAAILVLAAIFAIGAQYQSQSLGIHALERQLPKVIKMEAIELHYLSKKSGADDMAMQLARDAEFHVGEIKKHLAVELQRPIAIFAYETERDKKLLFGGGQTDVTDVWTPTVHIQLEESPHPTLRHELVHAVSSFASWHGIGFHPNMVLTEGLAMALAPTEYSLTFDQLSAGLIKYDRLGHLESLFNPLGFWSEAGGRSYVVAGSIIRWLGEKYGASAVRALYSGASLQKVTGKLPAKILEEWKDFVLSKYASQSDLLVEAITRDPGVLADFCPHSVADLARKRSDGWLVRVRQPIGWDPENLPYWRAQSNPMDREARLEASRKSLKTLFESNKSDKIAIGVWIEVMEKARAWPPRVLEDIEAAIIQSDLLLLSEQINESNNLLGLIHHHLQKYSAGAAIARQIEARLALQLFSEKIDQKAWRRYLAGWDFMPPPSEGKTWIESYLRGRRETHPSLQQIELWQSEISRADDFVEIKKEWLKMAGRSYAHLQQFEKAARVYDQLAGISTGEAKALAEEHQRRMVFSKSFHKIP